MAAGADFQVTRFTTATTKTILTPPSAGDYKRVGKGMLTICNKSGASSVVTLLMSISGGPGSYAMFTWTINPGDTWVNPNDIISGSTCSLQLTVATATNIDVYTSFLELT